MADEAPTNILIPVSHAPQIASYSPLPPDPSIEVAQARHRINLVNAFASIAAPPPTATTTTGTVSTGTRFLEIGCGQGNCTTVLASAAGARGSVTAIDPAPPTYGAPFTLADAQAVISASEVGSRITWHNSTSLDQLLLLQAATATSTGPSGDAASWDVAVLVHSSWYFRSPDTLGQILATLRGRARAVWLAEYALQATRPEAWAHVLAALARGSLEAHRGGNHPRHASSAGGDENIQTPLSPDRIREVAVAAGWDVAGEAVLVPDEGLLDGKWEGGTVVSEGFLAEIEGAGIQNERVKALLRSARDATVAAANAAGGVKKVRTMDVWAVVLKEKLET